MNRRTFAKSLAIGGTTFGNLSCSAARAEESYRSASPVDVGNKAQLFVDRVLTREAHEVGFTLHQAVKHPNNPLVVADRPWEGWRLELFGTVLHDEEEHLFKMWYIAEPVGVFGPPGKGPSGDNPTCYATSSDGIHWEKPLVGVIPAINGQKHNALLYATHLASVTKDRKESDPGKRYKMICYIQEPKEWRGYNTMISADGLHWTRHCTKQICPGSDVITGYYDETRKLWVAMAKIGTRIRGHQRRVFYLVTSADFETWTSPQLAIYPDLEDDSGSLGRVEQVRPILDQPDDPAEMRTEFYGVGFYPAESCTLGFPWVFTINSRARYGNQEGPFELQLAVTRDLRNWQRPFRTPCVARGTVGDWECGIQQTAARAIRVGDEIWLYYCGANYTHGTPVLYRPDDPGRKIKYTSSIGLAKWKLDRFVSADGLTANGRLTTVPVVFSGNRLELNARTEVGGSIHVELLNAARRPLAGFKPSIRFQGDELRTTIRWRDSAPLAALKGKPVTLLFHLNKAELYSFAFRD